MEKEFVTYDQALALKKLGFNDSCLSEFWKRDDGEIFPMSGSELFELKYQKERTSNVDDMTFVMNRPLKSQAFRWFREKYNLRGFIGFRPNVKKFDYHVYDMSLSGMEYVKQRTMEAYKKDPIVGTYEEAESACLDKLIEIVKLK